MPLQVLQADLDDPSHADAVVAILDSYARDPIGGGEPLRDEVRARLVPALRKHPTTLVLLAFAGDAPVGLAICFLGFSTFQARPLLNIHDLAVLPEWRGRGVGGALLAAIEAQARRRGCCKLTLEVLDANRRAAELYRKFGFADYSLGGGGRTWFMAKGLRDEGTGGSRD